MAASGSGELKFKRPSSEPYNLKNPTALSWSQPHPRTAICSDLCVLDLFKELKQGDPFFFVESGAYDGEQYSTTLALEKYGGWNGLLVEPNPYLYKAILGLNRKCFKIRAGLSTTGSAGSFPFVLGGPLGGFNHTLTDNHRKRLYKEVSAKESWMNGAHGSGKVINVPTYPLDMILSAIGKTDMVVDFWSLDTEGSEFSILSVVDWSKVTVGMMFIEHNDPESKQKILNVMANSGLLVVDSETSQDLEFYNPKYFADRGMPNPKERILALRRKG